MQTPRGPVLGRSPGTWNRAGVILGPRGPDGGGGVGWGVLGRAHMTQDLVGIRILFSVQMQQELFVWLGWGGWGAGRGSRYAPHTWPMGRTQVPLTQDAPLSPGQALPLPLRATTA